MDYRLNILLAILVSVSAGPAGLRVSREDVSLPPTACSNYCTEENKFSYAPGTTYEFKYDVETKTSMLGASEDHSTIGISATADIEVHSRCELVLKLHDVTIFGYDSKQYSDQDTSGDFARTLEAYPLRFSFQDGIVASVCPASGEAPWSVNFKRGLLSAFQNSMDSFEAEHKGKETDITGTCDTEYKVVQKGWRSLTMRKSKDISSCTDRHGYETAIQTTPFRISSGLKQLPIIKSTYTCDTEVKTAGTLTSSVCNEVHTFRPFSKDNSGATTETIQKLNYVQQRQGVASEHAESGKSTSLHFEHSQGESSSDLSAREALSILQDMCTSTQSDIRPDTPAQFSSLVYVMKKIDYAGLRRIYNQVKNGRVCRKNAERVRKFAIDAFPMVGTSAAVQLMKSLISNNDVSTAESDMWLASLAFIHHPTPEMLSEVKELLGLNILHTRVLLPLSNLVHAYCHLNPDCGEVAEVKAIVDAMMNNLRGGCVITDQNYKKTMMTLRAIGNMGHADESLLYECVGREDNPMDIRVAAVQAFRRLSCSASRDGLMHVLRRTEEDAELRLAAYLGVMQCPNQDYVDQVKEQLAAEEVNQVGSFVWSHLTNLMESSDPANKYVQSLLADDVLPRDFDLDKRKFSRNYEGSVFIDRLNTGAKIDSNWIWSSRSFMPRSASVNLTFDLFGESMNLLELGGRIEGLEHLLETYLGPTGYFRGQDNTQGPKANPRHAKLSSKKLNSIHEKAKSEADELRGAMYMRMFGNELTYAMFGPNTGTDSDVSGSDMFNFLQKLRVNEKQDLSMTKSIMFMDSTFTIPTISGLPLNMTLNGTATVALNAAGHVDMRKPGASIVIEGNFEPSGAVQIDTMMSVDAVVTRGGLKMVSTLHSSTGVRGKIEVTNGNVLDVTFDLTKEKSEILDVKTSFFMVYKDVEKEQRMIEENHREKSVCSGDMITRITGLHTCVDVRLPNATMKDDAPYFPFTGPARVTVAMYKRDIPNGYKLEAKTIKTPEQTLLRFMCDTPGSTENRAIGLDMVVKTRDKTLTLDLVSPWKKASLKGELKDTARVKGVLGTLEIDDQKAWNLDAKVLIEGTNDRVTYTPTITLEFPQVIGGMSNMYLTGVMNYQLKQAFDADLTITSDGLDNPVLLHTSLMNTATHVGAKATFNYEDNNGYVIEAFTERKIVEKRLRKQEYYTPRFYIRTPSSELVELTGTVQHIQGKSIRVTAKLDKITKKAFTATADLTKVEYKSKGHSKYNGRINLQGPKVSSKVMFLLDSRAWKTIFSKLRWDYNFGKSFKDTIIVNNKIKRMDRKYSKQFKMTTFVNSLRNSDYDANLDIKFISKRFGTNLATSLQYGPKLKEKTNKKRLDLVLTSTHKLQGTRKTVNYTATLRFPPKNVDVYVNGGHIHDGGSFASDVSLRYHPERTIGMSYHFHNRTVSPDLPSYAGQLSFSLPNNRELMFAAAFSKERQDKYLSSIEFEIIRGRRLRIDTMVKIVSDKMYELAAEIHRANEPVIRAAGGFTRESQGFTASGSFSKGDIIYSVSTTTMLDPGNAGRFEIGVIVPSRHVKIAVSGSQVTSKRHVAIDIQWDADRDEDAQFVLNSTVGFKSWDRFDIFGLMRYPTRTVELNMKHTAGDRYITHFDLSWSPRDKIEMSVIFRNDTTDIIDRRIELSVNFRSPFKHMDTMGVEVSYIKDVAQYQTKGSITWARKRKILVSTTAKVPITAQAIDIVGTLTTPFEELPSLTTSIKHRMENRNGLQSSALVQWGRKKLSLNFAGQMQMVQSVPSWNGNIDLRTPFEGLRTLILSGQHFKSNAKQNSKLSAEILQLSTLSSANKYSVDLQMSHGIHVRQGEYSTKGSVQVVIPDDTIDTEWEVDYEPGSLHTLFDIQPRRGNRFKVQFDESHQSMPNRKFTSSFDLQIPTESVKELAFSFAHEDKPGYLRTNGVIRKDNLQLFSTKVDYLRDLANIQFDFNLLSAYTEDVTLKLTSSHSLMPYRSNMQFQWAPYQKITTDTSFFYNEFGMFESTIKFSSPFERIRQIDIRSSRQREGLNWATITEVTFGPYQKIVIGSTYRFDHVKLTTLSVKTPFPQFPGFETAVKLNGNAYDMNGDASFTMQPYVGTISANFDYTYYKGTTLSGTFNLKTPYRQYPYMTAKVNSNVLGMSRVSSIEVEYLPTQVVKIDTDYRFTSAETLEGTITVASPFTDGAVTAGFKHTGNAEEFTSNAKITCDCIRRPVFTETIFSSKQPIQLKFVMDSPFRGYETTKFTFRHNGEINGLNTNLDTKAEYETNGKKISYASTLKLKDAATGSISFETPFPAISHSSLLFTATGQWPNFELDTRCALNDKVISSRLQSVHNPVKSAATLNIRTPFVKYEAINAELVQSGSVDDMTVHGELVYGQVWAGDWRHKYDGQDVFLKTVLTSPLLEGDKLTMCYNHTGTNWNFVNDVEYSVGSKYRYNKKTWLIYDIPNINTGMTTSTEAFGNVTSYQSYKLQHAQRLDDIKNLMIKSQLLGQWKTYKVNFDFDLHYRFDDNRVHAQQAINMHAIVELPHPQLHHSQLDYVYTVRRDNSDFVGNGIFSFETPLLEPLKETYKVSRNGQTFKTLYTYEYGDSVITEEQMYTGNGTHGTYYFKLNSPFEGYELLEIDTTYGYAPSQMDVDLTITATQLQSPIVVKGSAISDYSGGSLKMFRKDLMVTYNTDQTILYEERYTPGHYRQKTATPFEGYESTEIQANYALGMDESSADLVYSTSSLSQPIKAEYQHHYMSPTEMDFKAELSTGFTMVTDVKLEATSQKIGVAYKPVIKVSWEDEDMHEQVIVVDGTWTWKKTLAGKTAAVGLDITTPFVDLRDLNVQLDHKHFTSPMRAKDFIIIQHNNKRYLDMNSEVSVLNKISAAFNVRQPRQMEFTFSGVNAAESVEGDVILNWNKEEPKSKVRFQFGLADTGNKYTEKKNFHMRLTNPDRIVSVETNFSRTADQMVSSGKVSWDEQNGKQASYESEYNRKSARSHDTSLKLHLPARHVEMHGEISDDNGQMSATGNFYWDASTDRNKQVTVKVNVSTYDVKKVVQVDVDLPSFNKHLSMKSENTYSTNIMDGTTEFVYSKDKNKMISILYFIDIDAQHLNSRWRLRHPFTKTDIEMATAVGYPDTLESWEFDWGMNYTTARSERKSIQVHSDVNRPLQQINLQVITPDDRADLIGHVTSESPYVFQLETMRNSRSVWKVEWDLDTLDRTLNTMMFYRKDNMKNAITTIALFPNETSFMSETQQELQNSNLRLGHVDANLDYRRLHCHILWRPQILQDVMMFGEGILKQATSEVSSVMGVATKGVGDELMLKYRAITASMAEELSPLMENFAAEVAVIQQEVREVKRELRRMHKRNDMYLRTLEEMYSGAVGKMMSGYYAAIANIQELQAMVEARITELTNMIDTYPFQQRYNAAVGRIASAVQAYKTLVREELDMILQELSDKVKDLSVLYVEMVDNISNEIRQTVSEVLEELTLTPYMDTLKSTYDDIMQEYPDLTNLRDVKVIEVLNKIQELIVDVMNQSSISEKYRLLYARTRELMNDQFSSVFENEELRQLYQTIVDLYEQVTWVYKYTEMDTSLRQLIDKLVAKVRQQVMNEFNQLPIGLLDLPKSEVTTFDLENGEIEFDLYLPIPMENFDKLLRFSFDKYVKKLKKLADKYFPRRDFHISDFLYRFKPIELYIEKDWVPPFDVFATVSGKQFYTTFDGRHLDMAGLCSYILVEDTTDRDFTVIQKYSGGPQRLKRDSLVAMLHGKTIEMFSDYRVQVNGQPTELPYVTDKLRIVRVANRIILHSEDALDIVSDFTNNYHVIGLSGWYFGKVAGLLGTYDNEQYNDLMTPEGRVTENVRKFMNSWEVAGSCKSMSIYVDTNKGEKNDKCSASFEVTGSPMRSCFLRVEPESYLHTCNREPTHVCELASLYALTCSRRGINVHIPHSCVKCAAHANTMYTADETLRYEKDSHDHPLQASMDVVFVTEERQCNRDAAYKLGGIVHEIEQSLSKTGISGNRYSLLSYAGSDVHSHTMEGQLFNDANKFSMGVESLKFANLGPYTDPLTAVLKATELPFRNGVTKTIILVSCSPCTEVSGYSYISLNSVLQQRDITLHILLQNSIHLKNNRAPKSTIYGVDSHQLYLGRQRGGETDLFSDIDMPADYCSSLAMNTNGSLFDATNVLQSNLRQQRAFMGVVGDRIGQVAAEPACQECNCELDATGTPVSVCNRCDQRPYYIKSMPRMVQSAVDFKNTMTYKLTNLF